MFLLLIRPVFFVYSSLEVEKSDTFLHSIHPDPFDPHGIGATIHNGRDI